MLKVGKLLLGPVAAAILLLWPGPAIHADRAEIAPLKDNTIYSEAHAESNGSGHHMFTGRSRAGDIRRAVIAFDVAGEIPRGSIITGAKLRMNLSRAGAGASRTVSLHRLLADWGESASNAPGRDNSGAPATSNDATWVQRFFPATPWRRAGGDFAAVESAGLAIGPIGNYVWTAPPQVIADVQTWLDDPLINFGWILIGAESANSTSIRFDSKEHPREENHPLLLIEFMPPDAEKLLIGYED
jgi:hypothetical protein